MLTNRWRPAAIAAAALALAGGLCAGAAPALAISGIEEVREISEINSTSAKTVEAKCPRGKDVIGGGGGLVWDEQHQSYNVILTRLQPFHAWNNLRDSYIVGASETSNGETDNWWIEAVALCADPIPGLRVESEQGGFSSAAMQNPEAHCDPGEKVLGTGASVSLTNGEVGLQVARASTTGDWSYAFAHEDPDGYQYGWYSWAFAVCAPEPAGYDVNNWPSAQSDSEAGKVATATCPAGTTLTGAGGATSFNAPGNVFLSRILVDPQVSNRSAEAIAIEAFPTATDWDFIVGQAICAD
jgi:hypothetical protein